MRQPYPRRFEGSSHATSREQRTSPSSTAARGTWGSSRVHLEVSTFATATQRKRPTQPVSCSSPRPSPPPHPGCCGARPTQLISTRQTAYTTATPATSCACTQDLGAHREPRLCQLPLQAVTSGDGQARGARQRLFHPHSCHGWCALDCAQPRETRRRPRREPQQHQSQQQQQQKQQHTCCSR